MPATLDDARRAKAAISVAIGDGAQVMGVGVTKVGDSYAVKVNLQRHPAKASLPTECEGVPVVYEIVGQISSRGLASKT